MCRLKKFLQLVERDNHQLMAKNDSSSMEISKVTYLPVKFLNLRFELWRLCLHRLSECSFVFVPEKPEKLKIRVDKFF